MSDEKTDKGADKAPKTQPEAKAQRGYKVAAGKAIVGLSRILADGASVTGADLNGGEEALKRALAKGRVVVA